MYRTFNSGSQIKKVSIETILFDSLPLDIVKDTVTSVSNPSGGGGEGEEARPAAPARPAAQEDQYLTHWEEAARPAAAAMAAAFDEKVAKPLQDAADEACGTSDAGSGLSAALWARESHKDGHYAKQHDENTEEKIRYGKGVVHGSSPFLARKRLMINDDMASPPPASIASQFGLSNEENTGATTPIAKNTFPALSKILESRLIWPTVNTGSFQMYRTPNDSIASYSTTIPQNMSTDFSLIPRVFAAGGSAPSGGSGLGCAAARMAVVMAKGVAGFIENSSWQMPHRAAVQYLGGSRLYLQNKTTGDQDGTGGTSYVPAASSQTRQPRLTEAFDRRRRRREDAGSRTSNTSNTSNASRGDSTPVCSKAGKSC